MKYDIFWLLRELSLWSWGDDIDSEEFSQDLLLRLTANWFVNESNENIRNFIRLKKKKKEKRQ